MTAAKMMRQTKVTLLLSLNAVAIIIVGVMIFSAINLNGGIGLKVVDARNDVIMDNLEEISLVAPGADELKPPSVSVNIGGNTTTLPQPNNPNQSDSYTPNTNESNGGVGNGKVGSSELWNETAITMYQTADFDICVAAGLGDLGEMYWQSDNPNVISKFYNQARTWLGYTADRCRYPVITGTGTTTITAGTYDGRRHDKITITVIAPPVEQWKRDVLNLVNQERAKHGLAALSWGTTCEAAANTRAREIMTNYSHTRPNGSSWSTTCPIPQTGGKSGENLNVGNAAVSPSTVVASWMNSPDHRKNILDPDFKFLSVGFIFDPNSQHKTYWSQYFTTY